MLIPYTRSSSLGQYEMCQMAYFMIYNLGLDNPPNVKAQIGSATHKVLECLAIGKQYLQQNPSSDIVHIEDGELGHIEYNIKDWNAVHVLSDIDVAKINSTRVNKDFYEYQCNVIAGQKRTGLSVVSDLIKRSIQLYKTEKWAGIDEKHVDNCVWIALEYQDGIFDPRNRDIFLPEGQFQIDIDRPWARFEYELDGKIERGCYGIKGTIDLITKIDEDTIEIIDWKTGKRKNWATDEEKTYDKLCKDPQLMLYYYAASHLYPQFKNIIITIFFIRSGGPFTICFEPHHIYEMEEVLKKHYLDVSGNMFPKMRSRNQSDFQCTRLCHFYKNKIGDKNVCQHIHDEIKAIGLDETIEKYKKPGFTPNHYSAPGEV